MASEEDAIILDSLFDAAMKKNWEEVVIIYTANPRARTAKRTNSDETALHVVISSYRWDDPHRVGLFDIKKMIDPIPPNQLVDILLSKNDKGNTILHVAAAVGWADLCEIIASKDDSLINARNQKNETPLFVAAHYGYLDAVRCLHDSYMRYRSPDEGPDYSLCRRGDGNTVLHLAIAGEHFELASWITENYRFLTHSVSEAGERPLHVLTRKIAVLSSSYPGLFGRIISYWVEGVFPEHWQKPKQTHGANEEMAYPRNYETCGNIVRFLCYPIINTARGGNPNGTYVLSPQCVVKKSCSSFCAVCSGKSTNNGADEEMPQPGNPTESLDKHQSYPPNYTTCISLLRVGRKVIATILLTILGIFGSTMLREIQRKKEKQQQYDIAVRIMNVLIHIKSLYIYKHNGEKPLEPFYLPLDKEVDLDQEPPIYTMPDMIIRPRNFSLDDILDDRRQEPPIGRMPGAYGSFLRDKDQDEYDKQKRIERHGLDTPLLLAAKMGVDKMVEKILMKIPTSIQDLDSNGKNVVMLAAENRHTNVFNYLLSLKLPEDIFYQNDHQGNSILHLAAKLEGDRPPDISGSIMEMHWEIKWYKYVKHSLPRLSYAYANHDGETAKRIFTRTHQRLALNGIGRLVKTSESCSFIAALIATVTFATSAAVPGGLNQVSGRPIMENQASFAVFSISSLVAFCQSVMALVFFLTLITSRFRERHFLYALPRKLFVGLTALLVSIGALLVSFFAGYTFVLEHEWRIAKVAIYTVACGPLILYAFAHLPLFFELLRAAFTEGPLGNYNVCRH